MKVKECYMTKMEEKEYELYLIHVEGYPYSEQIKEKEYEDAMLLEQIAEYKGGYADEYVLKK